MLDTLISVLTSADVQSTITPDEGRNCPWHYHNIAGVETARQTFMGLDGLSELVQLRSDGPLREAVREIVELGGYYAAVEAGEFVDSGRFPERAGDGIVRDPAAGSGAGTVVPREPGYGAPVCSHFGANGYVTGPGRPCDVIGGCTLCDDSKIVYIDELDPDDNVHRRLEGPLAEREAGIVRPQVERAGDGVVCVTIFVPAPADVAEAAALGMTRHLGLAEPMVLHRRVLHPAEGSVFEIKGVADLPIRTDLLALPERVEPLSHAAIEAYVRPRGIQVVAATVGEDEHSVGLQEILDLKHGGIERYGFECHRLGTSVPVEQVLDAAERCGARAVLISTILTHGDVHKKNMERLHRLAVERGLRDRLVLVAGGTQLTDEVARSCGMDAGFGRGTTGQDVASFLVCWFRELDEG